jgi:hypothetical protein
MDKLLTVPLSRKSRKEYRVAMRDREGGGTKPALTAADSYLEIIASRSCALASCYAVFLALISVMLSATTLRSIQVCLLMSGTGIVAGMLFLFRCLWIKWASDPRVYQHPIREYRRTIDMVCDLSIWFNASILIAIVFLVAGLIAFCVDRATNTTSPTSQPILSGLTVLASDIALTAVDRCSGQQGDAQKDCYWSETTRLSKLAAKATDIRPPTMTADEFAEAVFARSYATILQMSRK